jgi:hypothetical protein
VFTALDRLWIADLPQGRGGHAAPAAGAASRPRRTHIPAITTPGLTADDGRRARAGLVA